MHELEIFEVNYWFCVKPTKKHNTHTLCKNITKNLLSIGYKCKTGMWVISCNNSAATLREKQRCNQSTEDNLKISFSM